MRTSTQIASELGIPRSTVKDRIYTLGIVGTKHLTRNILYYDLEQYKKIKKSFSDRYSKRQDYLEPMYEIKTNDIEIIYVTRTIEIIPSKLNFLTIEQL